MTVFNIGRAVKVLSVEKASVQLLFVLLFVMLCLPGIAQADDPVYFADENLKLEVEDALGISDPTEDEMLNLTELNVPTNTNTSS